MVCVCVTVCVLVRLSQRIYDPEDMLGLSEASGESLWQKLACNFCISSTNVMKAVLSARWVSIHLCVPRLVNALASWSQAVSIAEAGRREAMAKHIEQNLDLDVQKNKNSC